MGRSPIPTGSLLTSQISRVYAPLLMQRELVNHLPVTVISLQLQLLQGSQISMYYDILRLRFYRIGTSKCDCGCS